MRIYLTTLWLKLMVCYVHLCVIHPVSATGDALLLSDYLWMETEGLRVLALNTLIVQGLKNVSLDPTDFGAYMVQDAVYMLSSKESIDVSISKTTDPDLKQFLQETAKSYESLYTDLFQEWHIEDPHAIKLGSACFNYTTHLRNVANTMDPAYLVVAMIPCVKLWPWIGVQIGVNFNHFGVYTKWIQTNFDPGYKGYKVYDAMVNDAFKEGLVDKDKALSVFETSMNGEVDFFSLL